MKTETLLYILMSGIIALLVALFQYGYKSKQSTKLSIVFAFLRFISVFSVLLLLINPEFEQLKTYIEKPHLVLVVDNSNSIKHLKQSEKVIELNNAIKGNEALGEKFRIDTFSFGSNLSSTDTLHFELKETNIDKALNQLSEIYKNDVAPIVLLSDGNQTFGNDYSVSNSYNQPIYPIALGDTTTHHDLRIQQLNVNRYAFLKNKFPIEAILVYQGNTNVTSNFLVKQGNKTVYSKTLNFSKADNSKVITLTLPANRAGVNSYRAVLEPLSNEKNKINNVNNFAVEVIDQKTNVAIISDISHPDLGAFKKSIETNEQRSVEIISPEDVLTKVNDFQLFILYQPNNKFRRVYKALNEDNKNRMTVIGVSSNLGVINRLSEGFTHEITGQNEDYQAQLNLNFSPFILEDINFESFPPLKSKFGDVSFKAPHNVLLEKRVLGVANSQPLLTTFELSGRREALLLGENIWQWRAQSYLNENSFNSFDDFMGKLVQYLASNKIRGRLNVDYESFYNGNRSILLKAQIFDKNYVFDSRQNLEIVLRDNTSETTNILPLILKNNNYQIDLSGLAASTYSFSIRTKDGTISKSGAFEVLEYNIEQQFLNADVTKLQQLASNTRGKHYLIDESSTIVEDLIADDRYKPIQKSNKNTIPLIDWKYLLALIALSLSAEWFLRKYNGLI